MFVPNATRTFVNCDCLIDIGADRLNVDAISAISQHEKGKPEEKNGEKLLLHPRLAKN